MPLYEIAEVFGHHVDNHTAAAWRDRERKWCPFQDKKCTKDKKKDPLGICSLTDGDHVTSLCPHRFVQDQRIFSEAARITWGDGVRVVPVPEVKILREEGRKIGKVDFLIAKLDDQNKPVDFAALEVQAVYFSGNALRPAMNEYLRTKLLPPDESRRPDYRSSAQKRLMPQLRIKVPVFRRWGKRFFVVVDDLFFKALPKFRTVAPANTEITWLSFPISRVGDDYSIREPQVFYSVWDDVLDALREGEAPEPQEIIQELQRKMKPENIITT